MRHRATVWTLLLAAALAHAYQLSGEITDAQGRVLAGVNVSLLATGVSATSASDGSWTLAGTTRIATRPDVADRAQGALRRLDGRLRISWDGTDALGRAQPSNVVPDRPSSVLRFVAAVEDTLAFTRNGRRLAAFPVQLDSLYDLSMRLDTATRKPLVLRSVAYSWSRLPALACLLTAGDTIEGPMDSLTVRMFLRSPDTLAGTRFRIGAQGLETVPVRFADALAIKYDLCHTYDASGFNKPCDDPVLGGGSWSWGSVNQAVQLLPGVKLEGTRDPATGTSIFAFDAPLGPTVLREGGRFRFDLLFAGRSEYSRVLNASQAALLETYAKPYLVGRTFPAVADTGWFDAMDTPPMHAFGFGDSVGLGQDWSFQVHSQRSGDPVGFQGVPRVASQTVANQLVDNPYQEASKALLPPTPYLCVYRKGKLLWGYPPLAPP